MKLAIIGAAGKTGIALVHEALARGHQVNALCRSASAGKLTELANRPGFTLITAPSVIDASALQQALSHTDAALVILIAVHDLKASALVAGLADASAATGCRRVVFTAGEITAIPAPDERQTLRQRMMLAVFGPLMALTPYSLRDMREASHQIQQFDWEWTIIRAPTLIDAAPAGYRLGALDAVRGADRLSRADYAACLIDSVAELGHHQRLLTVLLAAQTSGRAHPR
jgi:putative NADH-flavin reductase